jgi:hypothetical protein
MVFNDLAILYDSIGDKRNAGARCERAVAIDPAETTFTNNLVDFYCVAQNQLEDALHLNCNIINGSNPDVGSLTVAGRICVRLLIVRRARTPLLKSACAGTLE